MDNKNETMNTKNEQNSEMNSASMHDVPLSNEDVPEDVPVAPGPPVGKIPSKSGSLKRFFKITSSRKSLQEKNANANANADTTDTNNVDADNEDDENAANAVKKANEKNKPEDNATNNDDENAAAGKPPALGRERSRRFNFRFGHNAAEGENPTSSNNAPATSRHSLRGSLSTYFNSVFKRKQAANSKHTLRSSKKKDDQQQEELPQADNDDDSVNENSIEMVEQKLVAPEPELTIANTDSTDTIEPVPLSANLEDPTQTATSPRAQI